MNLEHVAVGGPFIKDQFRVTNISSGDVGSISDEFRSFVASLGSTSFVSKGSLDEFARQVRVRYSEQS